MKPCYRCGTSIADNAITCVSCGAIQPVSPPPLAASASLPPRSDSLSINNGTLRILMVIYLALIGLGSLIYLARIPIFNLALTIQDFLLVGIPNAVNIGAVIFLIIQISKLSKRSPLLFAIWGLVFMFFQVINWSMVWQGRHIFRANMPLYLWAGVNLVIIILLAVFLFSKDKITAK